MKHFIYCFAFVTMVVSVSGCLLKKATDDLEDAWDDAMKRDGQESCEDILEDVYETLDNCSEEGVLEEGQTAMSAAQQWCADNCNDLSDDVDYDKYSSCSQAIWDLECGDATSFIDLYVFISECSWLSSTLDC